MVLSGDNIPRTTLGRDDRLRVKNPAPTKNTEYFHGGRPNLLENWRKNQQKTLFTPLQNKKSNVIMQM